MEKKEIAQNREREREREKNNKKPFFMLFYANVKLVLLRMKNYRLQQYRTIFKREVERSANRLISIQFVKVQFYIYFKPFNIFNLYVKC
jgi:hypothetical protein